MDTKQIEKPDFLFEVSWEVCNKVGGINTVIATKALQITSKIGTGYIMIGPDIHTEPLPEDIFIEDDSVYSSWVAKAREDGFNFRIGRWNIKGNPVAILINFTGLYSRKDIVFKELWEKYKLDSLYGGWDYIEPTLFGYETARLIRHFYRHNVTAEDRILAHFHEWMTGAGILYLKDLVPQIGCIFTTHATVLGRSIAGINRPLYSKLNEVNPTVMASELNVISKYSLERLSAENADVFTTVSEITGNECKYLLNKAPDIVTPNGFEDAMVPVGDDYINKRNESRKVLKRLVKSVLGKQPDDDAIYVINSGRYEFRNKGIDLFLESLKKLKNSPEKINREIIAIIAVPANNAGVRLDVRNAMENDEITANPGNLTHYLFNEESDAIAKSIREMGICADKDCKVNVIFVPCYLNGNDGLINLDYYDLLIGCDISVFPSYYEPWGYTPLEAVAFHIPTVTTTLAGFGRWMLDAGKSNGGVKVIERDDFNNDFVVDSITECLLKLSNSSFEELEKRREDAFSASKEALWENLIHYYYKAYDKALNISYSRRELYSKKTILLQEHVLEKRSIDAPAWRKIFIKPELPQELKKMSEIFNNLWWTWNHSAINLFSSINPELWERSGYNPIAMMELMSYDEIKNLASDSDFKAKLDAVYNDFKEYMSADLDTEKPSVAYLCMEYGFHVSMKLYSGGLGVLAGDYLKEASDNRVRMTAVGLLFRYGYFSQSFTASGEQVSEYIPQKFSNLPMEAVRDENGKWIKISVVFPGRQVFAKIWKVNIGRVSLYLLDTDIEDNNEQDRQITHRLYGGDWENRLKQEYLLGIGGIKMLNRLGISTEIYHCNEGHAAFSILERVKNFVRDNVMSFQQALEIVRSQTLFTTHTPVPAGHDSFSEDLMRIYFANFNEKLNISWSEFMALGRMNPDNNDEKFSMSVLALDGSQNVNGVSRIHGRVTREMFTDLYPGYFTEELYIDYVTNGVHLPTWCSEGFINLAKEEGVDFYNIDQSDPANWNFFNNVPENKIWDVRKNLKKRMIEKLKAKLYTDMTMRQESPRFIMSVLESLDENALYIGFARRFATYKRANLIFRNLDKLKAIVNDPNRPVKFIYAGKAHPADKAGQDYIKKIIEISHMPDFAGKIIFVENYDMEIAKYLIPGVDVWMNTPTRPLEASGTSGIKACLNGVLNLSVLDGWWAEGYVQNGGWALKEKRTYKEQLLQDELDSETLYNIIRDEIKPLFFDNRTDGVPVDWISFIRKNFTEIAPHFTMKRMIDQYFDKFYIPQSIRAKKLTADSYLLARNITSWKRKFIRCWKQVKAVEVNVIDSTNNPLSLGQDFVASIKLSLGDLKAEDLAIDVIFGQKEKDVVSEIIFEKQMSIKETSNGFATYEVVVSNNKSGVFDYAFRLRPNNPDLPHLQDFNFVKWL
ncbi:MAG: alpha-glucan family phosphorylase [Bacteroidales bacterium]|nr:alpha-glucan family phosphorylase [Bacteroidales bacterium]